MLYPFIDTVFLDQRWIQVIFLLQRLGCIDRIPALRFLNMILRGSSHEGGYTPNIQ